MQSGLQLEQKGPEADVSVGVRKRRKGWWLVSSYLFHTPCLPHFRRSQPWIPSPPHPQLRACGPLFIFCLFDTRPQSPLHFTIWPLAFVLFFNLIRLTSMIDFLFAASRPMSLLETLSLTLPSRPSRAALSLARARG